MKFAVGNTTKNKDIPKAELLRVLNGKTYPLNSSALCAWFAKNCFINPNNLNKYKKPNGGTHPSLFLIFCKSHIPMISTYNEVRRVDIIDI